MRINKLLMVAFAALAVFSCKEKEQPAPKDTTPAELKSFALLQADNPALPGDVVAEISKNMIIRVPGSETGKTFVATVTAGEFDQILVNNVKPGDDGKVEVNSAAPIDIIVTNTKSELTATYEVKIGKILQTVVTAAGSYMESEATLRNDVRMAIGTNGIPYLLYSRKKTTEGAADSNNRLACISWNGAAFAPVGTLGFTDDSRQAIACNIAIDGETPYVVYYGETAANMPGVRKFDGAEWVSVGEKSFGNKISYTYGGNELYFIDGKPGFVTTGNDKKGDADAYRNAVRYNFNGTDWTQTNFIPNLPHYGDQGASDGVFYAGVTAKDSKGNVYVATSSNLYGYYLFNVSNNWEMMVENFLDEGEPYGVPGCLSVLVGPEDVLYVFASVSSKAQYQLYRYNANSDKKLEAFAGPIQMTAGGSGTIKETMRVGVNPVTGEIVGAYVMDSKLYFGVIDENRQWTEFTEVPTTSPVAAGDAFALKFAPDGTGYLAVVLAPEKVVTSIDLFKIGLEEDILPE